MQNFAAHSNMAERQVIAQPALLLLMTYKKADLVKVVGECAPLPEGEKKSLYKLLKRCEFLFDGTLGT